MNLIGRQLGTKVPNSRPQKMNLLNETSSRYPHLAMDLSESGQTGPLHPGSNLRLLALADKHMGSSRSFRKKADHLARGNERLDRDLQKRPYSAGSSAHLGSSG